MKEFFKKKVVPILIDVIKSALVQTIMWGAKIIADMLSKKFDNIKSECTA